MKVSELITKINEDEQLRSDLQARWNRHDYPDSSIVFAQLTIGDYLMVLSDTQIKLAIFLGMHCSQMGLIQISLADIVALTSIKRSSAQQALSALQQCGAIYKYRESKRHAAPIWLIDPAFMRAGKRSLRAEAKYKALIDGKIKPQDYLFQRQPELVAHKRRETEVEPDGTWIQWNDITPMRPEIADLAKKAKKKPSGAGNTQGPNVNTNAIQNKHTADFRLAQDPTLDKLFPGE